jgi:hypothetical protein
MKLRVSVVLLSGVLVIGGCGTDRDTRPIISPPCDLCQFYTCACLDSTGTYVRAEVRLYLHYADQAGEESITGAWVLPHPESVDRSIFPFGSFSHSNLMGEIDGRSIWLTLTPGWCDVGFELNGQFIREGCGSFHGRWWEIGFAGITDGGLVDARWIGPCSK